MATVQDDFAAIDEGVWELGRSFDPDSWMGERDEAMRCRELEARIAKNLPLLRDLPVSHDRPFEDLSFGLKSDDSKGRTLRIELRKAATLTSHLLENVGNRIAAFENSGYAVAGSEEFLSLLRSSRSNLATMLERLDSDAPHSSNGGAPLAIAATTPPLDLPVPGEQVQVKARPAPIRLPDPPFETGERPPPFDLPRPSGGKVYRVKVTPGLMRLPDPIDD